MAFRIISFDGGGIRGLVSSLLLQNLDPDGSMVGKADMFAGTSTGSFLALGLASGLRLRDIADLYREKGRLIFEEGPTDWHCANPLSFEQQVAIDQAQRGDSEESIKSIFQAKYKPNNLSAALTGLLGERTMRQLGESGAKAVVSALQLWSAEDEQWAPVSIGTADGDRFAAMKLVDAAMSSSAAPTYFPPHQPEAANGDSWGYFSDGGMFANNPSAAAVAYAVKHYGADLADSRILSIGTGHSRLGISPGEIGRANCWGAWQWLRPTSSSGSNVPAVPLIEAALACSAAACEQFARQMHGNRFVRVNMDLEQPHALDDWANIAALEEAVETFVSGPDWPPIVDAVYNFWEAEDEIVRAPGDGGSDSGFAKQVARVIEDTSAALPPPPVTQPKPVASTARKSWLSKLVGG